MTAHLDLSTRVVNAHHTLNSKAEKLSRLLGTLGSPREQVEDFDLVIEAIGELLVAKSERDFLLREQRIFGQY